MKKIAYNFSLWLLERLQERSTWLGVISFFVATGLTIAPDLKEAIVTAGVALVGVVSIITKDLHKKNLDTQEAKKTKITNNNIDS